MDLYRHHQRTQRPRLENTIKSLRKELEDKANSPNLTMDKVQEHSVILARRIEALEEKRRNEARLLSSARNRLEREILSKHWVQSAREDTPRDTIRALRNPLGDPARREVRSDRMAEVAREYHEQLMAIDWEPSEEPDEEKLRIVLQHVDKKLSPDSAAELRKEIEEGEVIAALGDTANDKAAGLDGVPMELWNTGCIEGYPEPENHVRKAYKRTNIMSVFCI